MLLTDQNSDVWNNPSVVEHYSSQMHLHSSEVYAFDKYIRTGSAILDIGVGGGRTTPYLLEKASQYIGVDYSATMVEVCRMKFPTLEFRCEDATNLQEFEETSFDIVVFSFNGIDSICSDEGRLQSLREIYRVLRPGGYFIFSSHNAKRLGVWPNFAGADPLRIAWRLTNSVLKSVGLSVRSLRSEIFYKGAGYFFDPTHGGLITYSSNPSSVRAETDSIGFSTTEVIDGLYPFHVSKYFTPWYYYVLCRSGRGGQ